MTRSALMSAIRAHVHAGMSDDTRRLIAAAQYDLHCGPSGVPGEGYPGFDSACRRIAADLDIHDLWVSEDYDILDCEPQWASDGDSDGDSELGECRDMWSVVAADTVRRAVLGELTDYVGQC